MRLTPAPLPHLFDCSLHVNSRACILARLQMVLCIRRPMAERQNPDIQQAADKVMSTIVKAIKLQCPLAFTGLMDWHQALVAIVENTCVSTATITSDHQSPLHKDSTDICLHGMMSCVA